MAATDLMYAQGVAATTLAEVMTASGTGTSQMYHYFRDKDALVDEVVLVQIARMLETQERLLARVSSLRDLRTWRDAEVLDARVRNTRGCPLGSLAGEPACQSDHARRVLSEAFGTWQGQIAAALTRIRASGELSADADPQLLAVGVLAALEGGLLLSRTTGDPTRLEQALDAALRGLGG